VRLIDGLIGLKTHPASLIIYLIAKKMIRGIEFANEKWVDGLMHASCKVICSGTQHQIHLADMPSAVSRACGKIGFEECG
jgi:hypothetical protein